VRPSASSQAGRILALLEQGGWWSTSDLLKAVPAITHSRIADLRKAGYVIEQKTVGPGAQGSLYRITGFAPATGEFSSSPVVGGGPGTTAVPPLDPSPTDGGVSAAGGTPSQLALDLPARLREEAA